MSKKGMIYIETPKKKGRKLLYIIVILVAVGFAALMMLFLPKLTGGVSMLTGKSSVTTELPDPVQKKADGTVEMTVDDYDVTITEKYSYVVDALVVHTKNYSGSSIGDRLAPRDFALAWGNIPKYNNSLNFHWSQSDRWYSWSLSSAEEAEQAGGETYINTHSANTHIIPADDEIKKEIKSVHKGDHVVLTGFLVSIYGETPTGETFTWNSSTSREDTGDGACEVMYVTGVEIK